MSVLLSDICWTLYDSNTTYDFVDYIVAKRGMNGFVRMSKLMKSACGRFLRNSLFRISGRDYWRETALRQLRGMSKSEIEQLADEFAVRLNSDKRIEQSWEVMKQYTEVRLVSSTISPIANAVAKSQGWQVESSNGLIYQSNELFSGVSEKFDPCNKITDQRLVELGSYDIITDNLTDIKLICRAHRAYIVCYGNERRWQEHLSEELAKLSADHLPRPTITYMNNQTPRY